MKSFLLLIFVWFDFCSALPCPKEPGLCDCSEWSNISTVTCTNVQGQALRASLGKRLDGSQFFQADDLIIANSSNVAADMFTQVWLDSLELDSVSLDDCPKLHPNARMYSVVFRDVRSNFAHWDWSGLCRLTSLTLEGLLGLNNLSLSTLRHGETLSALKVTGCPQLTSLRDGALAKLCGLVTLDLSHNALVTLNRSSLPDGALKPRLQTLDLRFNQLTFLPDNMLEDLPQINLLKLNSNRLMTLHSALVDRATRKLQYIDFFDNPYSGRCDCSLKWILCRAHMKMSVNCRLQDGRRPQLEDHLWRTCGPA